MVGLGVVATTVYLRMQEKNLRKTVDKVLKVWVTIVPFRPSSILQNPLQVNYIQVTLKQHENVSLYSFACVCTMVHIKTTKQGTKAMKLRQIASNQTELTLPSGAVVLFSYETPVAAMLPSGSYVRTEKKWSVTTSRHINKWLQGIDAQEVPQADLYNLTGEAA